MLNELASKIRKIGKKCCISPGRILIISLLLVVICSGAAAIALESPLIGAVYFYWYSWDYEREWGNWIDHGLDNTPLRGYYDSRTYIDNYRSLHTASEWGITHHFMDFWGEGWMSDEEGVPRETVVMRAAEDLRKKGYNTHMSFYQDGDKFNMEDFSKNISDKENPDVRFWLDNKYAHSPVWPKHRGNPLWLVYARSGTPARTATNDGFREYLKKKYRDIDRLNDQWEAEYYDFDEITLDFRGGWPRVRAINYQYHLWQESMDEMNRLVQEKYGWPGILPSFDIWCEPYKGYGYSNYHRTFPGGPHSYGGTFGRPETQDVQRFIQTQVAKQYDSIFFDHYKHFYADWNIRIPGFRYAPDPYHFDRFWVGNLMRYAQAMLHLSWNEWWEGSELEPSLEHGKKFAEINLFYSTIMKETFDSINNHPRGAKVAVLLNDFSWLWGGNNPRDIYGVIQSLRLLSVPFELIADDFVDAKALEKFNLVIAPANGTRFGFNKDGESIAGILQKWVEGKEGRRLMVSSSPEFKKYLGAREGGRKVRGAVKKSLDFLKEEKEENIAWTVLGEHDERKGLRVAASSEGELRAVEKGGRGAKTVGENPAAMGGIGGGICILMWMMTSS